MATETTNPPDALMTEVVASPTEVVVAPAHTAPPAVQAVSPVVASDATTNPTPLEAMGVGTEGEADVWEGRYSMRNFLARGIGLGALTIGWLILAGYVWGAGHDNLAIIAVLAGLVLGFFWLAMVYRVALARWGHAYVLTNRRLFVATGVFSRRRDQMELLRVQDVYTRQGLWSRMLGVGTVVVVSTEPHFPMMYIVGVEDPKTVMDLIWHHARAERDRRSVKVDQV